MKIKQAGLQKRRIHSLFLLFWAFVLYNFIAMLYGLNLPGSIKFDESSSYVIEIENEINKSFQDEEETLNTIESNMQDQMLHVPTSLTRDSPSIMDKRSTKAVSTDNRPVFVIHVGPHKTATSSIQCEMSYYQSLLESFGNFAYLGRRYGECRSKSRIPKYDNMTIKTRDLVRCLDRHTDYSPCNMTREWRNFEQTLDELSRARQNVLLSDEAFSRMKLKTNKNYSSNLEILFQSIQNHGFQLKIVLVYRHYFSWLLSQYNEHYKPLASRSQYQIWPTNKGGKYIKSFTEYYASLNKNSTASSANGSRNYQKAANDLDLHPVAYLKKQWTNDRIPFSPKESDVHIIDMHNSDNPIVFNFVRRAVSEHVAKELERFKLGDQEEVPQRNNPSVNLDFDRLAVQARELGLVPIHDDQFTRRGVATYAQMMFQKFNITAMRQICLDESQMQQLQHRSLFLEQTVFPDRVQQKQHREDFTRAARRKMFCNLDIEAALAEERIKLFFKKLELYAKQIKE